MGEKSPGLEIGGLSRNSHDISRVISQSGMWEFDPCVVSQPLTQPERVVKSSLKLPYFIGFPCDFP